MTCGFRIPRVRLEVFDLSLGTPSLMAVDEAATTFDCRLGEATTPFRLPVGEKRALALRAFDPDAPLATVATSPPPAPRAIRRGEIVGLDVIELAVDPRPTGLLASSDGGVPFGLCPEP
jgi:hypothetical protein